jgi:phage recombination protein Bet
MTHPDPFTDNDAMEAIMEAANVTHLPVAIVKRKLVEVMADKYGLDPVVFSDAVKKVAMPQGFSNEEFAACLVVAHKYDLDPFTKQIYFMKTKGGTIQPIVSVDGWAYIVNRDPAHDGMTFKDLLDDKGKLVSITCTIRRKDRGHPIEVTEYLEECKGDSPAWKKTPARMLRHRAMMQCARYAYGIGGVMDQDEFEQWQIKDITPKSEADLAPKKSAAQAKRDGDGETFNTLIAAIRQAETFDALDDLLNGHAELLEQVPPKWETMIEDEANLRRGAIAARNA